MQFSIRLILLVTAYVALVVAAFASGRDWVADLAWVSTVMAMTYAALVAFVFVARDRRQVMALGFVILSLAYLVSLYIQPNRTLTAQVYTSAGYNFTSNGHVFRTLEPGVVKSVTGVRAGARAIDAASTLAAGFIGCGLGALAYRQGGDRRKD